MFELKQLEVGVRKYDQQNVLEIHGTYIGNVYRHGKRIGEGEFKIQEPVDVVEIDGKLYAIASKNCMFEPIPLNDIPHDNIEPQARFVTLSTGLVASKDLSDDAMKRIQELDDEFLMLKFFQKLDCRSKCEDYNDFSQILKRQTEIIREQGRIIAEELKKKGFNVSVDKWKDIVSVEITDPNNTTSKFSVKTVNDMFRKTDMMCYTGKWSPIGKVFYTLVKLDMLHEIVQNAKPQPIELGTINPSDEVCVARVVPKKDSYELFCERSGKSIITITRPKDILRNHHYLVRCYNIDKEHCIALSYSPIHVIIDRWDSNAIVTQHYLVEYGLVQELCEVGKHIVGEYAIENKTPISVISINGKLKYVKKDKCADLSDVPDGTNVAPEVEYIKLDTGLYVPKHFVDYAFLQDLERLSILRQAKELVEYLKKRGFRFEVDDRPSSVSIIVIGPDNDIGQYGFSYVGTCLRGKWSLLGIAYQYYLDVLTRV